MVEVDSKIYTQHYLPVFYLLKIQQYPVNTTYNIVHFEKNIYAGDNLVKYKQTNK